MRRAEARYLGAGVQDPGGVGRVAHHHEVGGGGHASGVQGERRAQEQPVHGDGSTAEGGLGLGELRVEDGGALGRQSARHEGKGGRRPAIGKMHASSTPCQAASAARASAGSG